MPQAVALPETKQLLIGADSTIHFLSWGMKKLTRSVPPGFLFRSFIIDRDQSLILVVHETGVAAFSMDGFERWKLIRDVVETVYVEADRLATSFLDEARIWVAIDSGRELVV